MQNSRNSGEITPVNFDGELGPGQYAVTIVDVLESEDKQTYAVKFVEQSGPLGKDGKHRMFWEKMTAEDFRNFHREITGKG